MQSRQEHKDRRIHYYLAGAALLVLCVAGWWFLFRKHAPAAPSSASAQLTRDGTHALPESLNIKERVILEDSLRALVAQETARGTIMDAAIYYRDLNNGPVISINGDAQFYPASLLKLPLALAYYKKSEHEQGFLDNQIAYSGPNGTSIEYYPGKRGMVPGTTYTPHDLIDLMIEESDNDAAAVLSEYIGRDTVDAAYADIGVAKVGNYNTYSTDVRTYSSFFRVLYNSTYLNTSDSEELLDILTHTSFKQGLVAGVPEGVTVAHKFGERVVEGQPYKYQLHDCGIVYVSQKNYILCVMTRGNSYPNLASFIATVSTKVYQGVALPRT